MNEFAKSRTGKKFFEFDIPKLIEAMQGLSTSINESNKIEEKKLLIEQKRYLNENHARITGSGQNGPESE